ncbi:MAG: membrane fusion protein (multidrug efflux system) [Chlamydiales bacterium]|jgi:membrane fusion protein (multidrug efflux system)
MVPKALPQPLSSVLSTELPATTRSLASLLVLSLALTSAACSKPGAPGSHKPDESAPMQGEIQRQEAVRVSTSPIEQREMTRATTTTTTIESATEIDVFPRATGMLVELRVEEGDEVAAGEVLAILDQREAHVAVHEAELSLKEARDGVAAMELAGEEANERLERAKLTWEQAVRNVERNEQAGLVSRQDLDQLRLTRDQGYRDLQAARVAVDAATQNEKASHTSVEKGLVAVERQQLNLSFTEIVAPFEGVIARRTVKVGGSVSPSASAFVLTDPNDLRAVFSRPQRELPRYRRAAGRSTDHESSPNGADIEIQIHAEAIPERVFAGYIQLVSPTIDPASGSFRVTVGLDDDPDAGTAGDAPTGSLLPGMLIRLVIITDRHPDALVIPKRALQREGETNFIYVARDKKAHRINVLEGFTSDDFVEVFAIDEPLEVGSAVIAVGNRDLEEGDAVNSAAWTADETGASHKPQPQTD